MGLELRTVITFSGGDVRVFLEENKSFLTAEKRENDFLMSSRFHGKWAYLHEF
jgi:hypothetical protein